MFLVVGLGNPGEKYRFSRHNTGFRVVDALCTQCGWRWKKGKLVSWAKGPAFDTGLTLVKPLTFMNASGEGLFSFLNNHHEAYTEIVIVHDEMDFPSGVLRLKRGGGTAGHKGLLSIADFFDIRDMIRVRIGVGKPLPKEEVVDYVLGCPVGEERQLIEEAEHRAVEAIVFLIQNGIQKAMTLYNVRPQIE
ncbi:MAG: aminoacyl-tRNA hydrolase [Candidatus Atribacteria bacterium]|nr:aminoacyl-tRNA hydrolase [Candidatus Atribacteria bacterium]